MMAVTQTKTHGNRGMAKPNGARQARAKSLREPFLPHTPPSEPAREYRGNLTAWDPIAGTTPVTLVERTGCCWPTGTGKPQLFCNAHVNGPTAYCDIHSKILKPRPLEAK